MRLSTLAVDGAVVGGDAGKKQEDDDHPLGPLAVLLAMVAQSERSAADSVRSKNFIRLGKPELNGQVTI